MASAQAASGASKPKGKDPETKGWVKPAFDRTKAVRAGARRRRVAFSRSERVCDVRPSGVGPRVRPPVGVKRTGMSIPAHDPAKPRDDPTLHPMILQEPRFTQAQRGHLLALLTTCEEVEVIAFDEHQRPVVKIWAADRLRITSLLKRGGEGRVGKRCQPWPVPRQQDRGGSRRRPPRRR
jgi:hypothetical protein